MSELHGRLARIVRDVLSERFASEMDQADAIVAAVITELGMTQEWSHEWAPFRGSSSKETALKDARSREEYYGLDRSLEIFSRFVTAWKSES